MKRRDLLRAIPFLGVLPFFRVGQQARWSGTVVERPTLIEGGFKAERQAMHELHKWYSSRLDEAEAVIKQLTEGPGDVEFIHPYDFADILNNSELKDLYRKWDVASDEFTCGGKRYRMSTLMPVRTKNIK